MSTPVYVVTIDGAVWADVEGTSLDINEQPNGLSHCSLRVLSEDGSDTPPLEGKKMTITEDGTLIFGGVITSVRQVGGGPADPALIFEVTASDFTIYTTWRFVTATLPEQTLKARMQALLTVDPATSYFPASVSLDGAQVEGPTLPERIYTRQQLSSVLEETCRLAGQAASTDAWISSFSFDEKWSIAEPGTVAAPFDVVQGDGKTTDITVETTRDSEYANRVLALVNSGPETSEETFTAADGVSSGGFTRWTTKYPAAGSVSGDESRFVWPNQLILNGTRIGPVAWLPTNPTFPGYLWDPVNHQLIYDESSGATFPSGGDTLTVRYTILYPFTRQAPDPSDEPTTEQDDGIVEVIIETSGATLEAAEAIAFAELARRTQRLRRISYVTTELGLRPGQTQHVTSALRSLDEDFLIIDVTTRSVGTYLERTITAVQGTAMQGKWQDTINQLFSGGGGAGGGATGSSGGGGGGVTLPSLPLQSVQSNQLGVFYGDERFTYDPDASTVMVGTGHTPGGSDNLLVGENHTVND